MRGLALMLPEGFVFSQSSLQDYQDCPRRFQLRYLQHRRWPAPETADALRFEHYMQQGYAFHRLMRQLHSGVAAEALGAAVASDPDLAGWWANYLASPPGDLPQDVCEAEVMLSTGLAGNRLEARYDLLVGRPAERWVIVDWKTSRHRLSRSWLHQRLQTRIYPLVLVSAGTQLNGGEPVVAEHVEMLYWFAEFPAQAERFVYSASALAADTALLEGMIREITERGEDEFAKTENRGLCRYCVYRSLCWDDIEAGMLAEVDDIEDLEADLEEIDLEAIAPIPF
jgi:predicted RecB family nuclease